MLSYPMIQLVNQCWEQLQKLMLVSSVVLLRTCTQSPAESHHTSSCTASHTLHHYYIIYTTLRKAPQNEWIYQRGQHGCHQHAADHDSLSDCVDAELCSCAHRKCKCVLPFKQKFKKYL